MNWKDAPHLFANGKFDLEHSDKHGNGGNYDAKDWGVHDGEIVAFYETVRKDTATYPLRDQCKLIARPISDMTDEEKCKLRNPDGLGYMVQFGCSDGEGFFYSQGYEQMLYLLSIGVYPFDDETDVIFKGDSE